MAKVIRRRYLGGSVAALSGLLAAACGEVEIRYVQGPAGPAGQAGARGATGATGASGAAGAAGGAGKTIVVEKPMVVEKVVERPVVVEKIVEVPVEKIVEKIVEVPAPPPKKAPVTLDFQHRWNGPEREGLVQNSIDLFMEQYEHITVDLTMNLARGEGTSGGVPVAKIIAQISAGQPPDVFMIHASAAVEFAERNALTWLDTFLARDKVDLAEIWFPAAFDMLRFRGQIFALSQDAAGDYPYIFYNKNLVEASGVDPKQFETWDGIVEASKTLTQADGETFSQIGYPFPSPEFTTWLAVNGADILSGDGQDALFNNAETIEALTWQTEAVNQVYGTYAKLQSFYEQYQAGATEGRSVSQVAWNAQRIGVWASGPWQWVWTPQQSPGLEMEVAPLPVNTANPKSKVTTLAASVWSWAMGAGLKSPDDSWLLQRWMSFEEGHRQLMVGMGRATMVKHVLADPAYAEKNPRMDLTMATLERATGLPQSRGWGKVGGLINGLPGDVLVGTGDDGQGPKLGVRDAVGQAAEKAQVELDKVYRS